MLSRSAMLAVGLSVLTFISTTLAQHEVESMDDTDPNTLGDEWLTEEDKKSGFRAVPFKCNGHEFVPRCQHGGRGPRKTHTRSGAICVCLCPGQWTGPECEFNVEMYQKIHQKRSEEEEEEKRSWEGLNYLQLGKRIALPWNMKQVDKKSFPWALKQLDKKSFPWALKQLDKKSFPWALKQLDKKSFPWALKQLDKKSFPWALKQLDKKAMHWALQDFPAQQQDENEMDEDVVADDDDKRGLPWALKAIPGKKGSWNFGKMPLGKRSKV